MTLVAYGLIIFFFVFFLHFILTPSFFSFVHFVSCLLSPFFSVLHLQFLPLRLPFHSFLVLYL